MKHNFTLEEKRNGEMAVRKLSPKAKWMYNNSGPVYVYEVGELPLTLSIDGEEVGDVVLHDYYLDAFGELEGPYSLADLDRVLSDMAEDFFDEEEE